MDKNNVPCPSVPPPMASSSPDNATAVEQKTSVKRFIFRSKNNQSADTRPLHEEEPLIVFIPERIEASYGLYVWPSAHLLSWYLYEHRRFLQNKNVLELGAGTALPGIVAALCGARVILSDSSKLPHCLEQARKSIEANGLLNKIKVVGITWGYFLSDLVKIQHGDLDLIIASDCFYDPAVFEDLLCTVAYLLEKNPNAKFLSSYQERSSDWSITPLLAKWGLQYTHILYNELSNSCEINLPQLLQGHTIHLLEIRLKPDIV